MNAKLTAKETALLTAVAEGHFSFFDEGLVDGSGIWTTCMTEEIAGSTKYAVSASERGVATVINSLGRKGYLLTTTNEDGTWTEITATGEAWIAEFNGETGEEVLEEAIAERITKTAEEAPVDDAQVHEYTEGDAEWIVTTFADNSNTLRRRRQVNGAWRTDFWGTTADGKKVSILSRDAKAARAAGKFTI